MSNRRRVKLKYLIAAAGGAALVMQLLIVVAALVLAARINLYILEAPRLDIQELTMAQTTSLYDGSDAEITALYGEQNRVCLRLEEIPLQVQQAFLAVEDRRFYEHKGFDPAGSIRALLANLRHGGITQGASTITQQVARNIYLPPVRTVKRKIQEIWLAALIERAYSKLQILEIYLNLIYFGNGAYGVEAAARTYFGKSIGEVNAAEAAMLAGMACAPNDLNPFHDQAAAEMRAKAALQMMREQGYLSKEEYAQASRFTYSYATPAGEQYPYPYFLDYVIHHELVKILASLPEFGSTEEAYRGIYGGGLRIYTTLDPLLQSHAEEVMNRSGLYPRTILLNMELLREKIRDGEFIPGQLEQYLDEDNGVPQPQAALVLADPAGGQVLALVGGRSYRKNSNEILRYLSLRQPGSAIKPLVVYAPAFEEKILAGAAAIIDDGPLTIGRWTPRNYDGAYHGPVTVRRALSYSYNVAAIRVFQMVTPPRGTAYASRMGISSFTEMDRQILSTAIGGLTFGVSAFDMAQAYSVLANGGVKTTLHTIRRIEDSQGRLLYQYDQPPEKILTPETCYLVTSILLDVVNYTTATGLRSGRPIAAKTGTTDQARDIYLVAYTPNIVASFWLGYDEPRLGGIPQGWVYSSRMVREVLSEVFKQKPPLEFTSPPGLVAQTVCVESGKLANEYCRAFRTAVSDWFLAGRAPRSICDLHREPPENDDQEKPNRRKRDH